MIKKKRVKWVRLDLSDLYELGHINITAAKLLERILEAYKVEYELLVNCSPDSGVEYFVGDKEFREAFNKAAGWREEEEVVDEYARERNAVAVVELFDGYEWAYALIYSE